MEHFEKQAKLTEKSPAHKERECERIKQTKNTSSKKNTPLNVKTTKPHY